MSGDRVECVVTELDRITVRVPSVYNEVSAIPSPRPALRKRMSVELSRNHRRERVPHRRRPTRHELLPRQVRPDPMPEFSTATLLKESYQAVALSDRKNSPPLRNDFPRRTPKRPPVLAKPERKPQTPSYYHNLMAFFNRKSIYSTTPVPAVSRVRKIPQHLRWLTPFEDCSHATTPKPKAESPLHGLVVQHCFK